MQRDAFGGIKYALTEPGVTQRHHVAVAMTQFEHDRAVADAPQKSKGWEIIEAVTLGRSLIY